METGINDECPHGLIGDDGIEFDTMPRATDQKSVGKPKSGKSVKRKDAPPLNITARGSKQKALTIAADDELMAGAMAAYVGDWNSASDTSEFYFRTWTQLHRAHWDGVRRPAHAVLPLVPLYIHVVGALLKVGGVSVQWQLPELG